jgi:hypothetical protein
MAAKLLVATENFMADHGGREVFVNAGTRVRATHPLAKAYPDLFGPVEPEADLEPVQARTEAGEQEVKVSGHAS